MNEYPFPQPEEESPEGGAFLPDPDPQADAVSFSEQDTPSGTQVSPGSEDHDRSVGDPGALLFPEAPDNADDPLPDSSIVDEDADASIPEPEAGAAPEDFSLDHEKLTSPELTDAISRDEDAYGFHGMPEPGEMTQPFDLSILDDPELDLSEIEDLSMDMEDPLSEAPLTGEAESDPGEFEDGTFREPVQEPEESPQQQPPRNHSVRKGRPRRKKGEGLLGIPNILVTVVWVGIVIAIGVTLGRMLWICAAEVLAFGREDTPVTVTIYETDTIDDITEKLYEANLIRYPKLFKLYASFAVDEGEIHPGIWDLNTRYDYHALVKMMSPSSTRSVVTLTIPEGYTCRQIFELLESNKVCTFNDLLAYCSSGDLGEYWFLEGISRGDGYCLEGYLFPDTYEFYTNDTPQNVLKKMLDNFDSRVTGGDQDLRELLPGLNAHLSDLMRNDGRSDDYIASHQFSMREVLIVASLIEKETSGKDESPTIASVIYNRLFNWGDTPAYLNIDASIIYALDGKTDLTAEDMKVDSPYNTYYNVGLTPGPIANPGLDSIQAALNPSSTNYYYYILDPAAGSHHFSSTLEEHEAFRASLSNG